MNKTIRIVRTLSCQSIIAAVLATGIQSVTAQSVGVNFVNSDNSGSGGIDNSQTASLLPAEKAGAPEYKQANWNNLSRYGSGVTLANSAGAATALAINWDAGSTVSMGTAAGLGTPDGKLMDGALKGSGSITDYTDPQIATNTSVYAMPGNAKPMVYVGGLHSWCLAQGAIGYSIVVYQTDGAWWGTDQMWVESVSGSPFNNTMVAGPDLTPHLWNQFSGTFNGTYSQIPDTDTNSSHTASAASYGVFSGLTNDAVLIRTGTGDYENGSMNGFQIIPIYPSKPSVGVNFVNSDNSGSGGIDNSQTASLLPAEKAGAPEYKQANWNNLSRYGSGVTLANSAGDATALAINWDADWTSSFGTATNLGTPDGKLMDGCLGGSGKITDYTDPQIATNTSVYAMPWDAKPMVYVSGLNSWCLAQGAVDYTIVVYQNDNAYWGKNQMWVESVSGSPFDNTMVAGPDLTPHLWNKFSGTFNGTYNKIPDTDTNSSLAAGAASYGVFRGLTNDAVLIRTGTGDYENGSMNGFQIIPGPVYPPVLANFTLGAVSGIPQTVQILGGKHAPVSPSGKAMTVTVVTYTSGNGASVSTDGTNVTYTALNTFSGADVFTYTVTDSIGSTATATVTVNVAANGAGYNQLAVTASLGGGDYRLSYVGIPGFNYALDWTASLAAPVVWTPQTTNTADANGLLIITNNQTGSPNFWRTRYVP